MKKSLIIIASLVAVMSLGGCGNKVNDTKTTPEQTAQADASGAYESKADNGDYSENVDMSKVDGKEAKSDTEKSSYSGEVNNNAVTINSAKLIEYDGEDVAVISFEFTNKTDFDQSFSGVFKVTAEQDGAVLPPATVIGVDGIELLTLSQNIAPGEKIQVQKAYKIDSKSLPLNVIVQSVGTDDDSQVTKTFEF